MNHAEILNKLAATKARVQVMLASNHAKRCVKSITTGSLELNPTGYSILNSDSLIHFEATDVTEIKPGFQYNITILI